MSIQEKRQYLKKLSDTLAELVSDGKYNTINEALLSEVYCSQTHQDFKTFHQWKKEGYNIMKGEKAFLLWGKPVSRQKPKEETTAEDETEQREFFPLCFVFSNAQVSKN